MRVTRGVWIGLAFLAAVVVGLFVAWSAQRKATFEAAAPPWLDPRQPPSRVVAPLTAQQSYAANHAAPMSASCLGHGAGRRLRRTYPPTLADSGASFVVNVSGGFGG
jgi:hypothetical protein